MPQALAKTDIRELRSWYGLSQADFARAVGVSERAVIRWEQGQVTPMPLAQRTLELLDDLRTRLRKRYGDGGAKEWLRRSNTALRRSTPLEILLTSGPTRVRDLVMGPETGTYR